MFWVLDSPQNAVNSTGSSNTPTKKERSLLSTKLVAKSDFTSADEWASSNCEDHTQHDYALSIRYTPGLNFKSTCGSVGWLSYPVVGLLSLSNGRGMDSPVRMVDHCRHGVSSVVGENSRRLQFASLKSPCTWSRVLGHCRLAPLSLLYFKRTAHFVDSVLTKQLAVFA